MAEEPAAQASWAPEGGEELPAHLVTMSRKLAFLLRHRAGEAGLCVRSDGFAKLSEVLSLDCMNKVVEDAAPGSGTGLYNGTVPNELLDAIQQIVAGSINKGRPRFEVWECDSGEGQDVWIRATQKHTLSHVEVELIPEGKDTASAAVPPPLSPLSQQRRVDYAGAEASATSEEGLRRRGRVKAFYPEKGFGFLTCAEVTAEDVFLHSTCIVGAQPERCSGRPGDEATGPEIEFDVEWKKGRAQAVNAWLVDAAWAWGDSEVPAEQETQKTTKVAATRAELLSGDAVQKLRDLAEVLPSDAPADVRAYLQGLVAAGA
jgi:cold shock CspA family protein